MHIVRINSRNVVFIILAILSIVVREAHMDYDNMLRYTVKEVNENSTPTHNSKKEENNESCAKETLCSNLTAECLNCTYNESCVYGETYTVYCSPKNSSLNCTDKTPIQKEYICRYCYQTEHWEYQCYQKNSCNSVASPQQYYRTNCTVNEQVFCLGSRKFQKNLPCNWTVGYRWSTALILSITLGGFGADRFYLGHWQEGIGKLFSFGGLGVWTLIDVMLISMRYLGPADGSLYI